MATYTDAVGRAIEISGRPRRIVSLVPSITEALFAFGAGEQVAGVTRFCTQPADGVAAKTKVGGTKNVDLETVAALDPDLVIANAEENARKDVETLITDGNRVFVTFARTVAEALDEIHTLGAMTGTENAAEGLVAEAERELEAASHGGEASVRVFCPIWRNPWMTIGPDTYIHDLLRVCGGENVFSDATERYPTLTGDDARLSAADVVLLPDEPYRFGEQHAAEVIEMVPGARIYYVDGKLLCWYGPRIPEAIRFLRRVFSRAPDRNCEPDSIGLS